MRFRPLNLPMDYLGKRDGDSYVNLFHLPGSSMNKLFDLTGKVAIVTGGNGGIGLGIAEGLGQAGAKLAIIGRNAAKSRAAAKVLFDQTGSEPLCLTADVAKPDETTAAI